MATDYKETEPERLAKSEKKAPRAVARVSKATRGKPARTAAFQTPPETNEAEEAILRKALLYLVRKQGMLLVPTGIREETRVGSKQCIIDVTLRYPTGHEGYIGELLFDGTDFEFLTPEDVRRERAKQIAEDPEGIRLWNEYRASTIPARED